MVISAVMPAAVQTNHPGRIGEARAVRAELARGSAGQATRMRDGARLEVQSAPMRGETRMPEKSAINLPAKVLALVETQIAYKSDLDVFETGAEFWEMLTVAAAADGHAGPRGSRR